MELECLHIPQAQVNKTRPIFFTATFEREEGNSVVFGQRSRAKGVDFVRLLYIIRLYLTLLICHLARV